MTIGPMPNSSALILDAPSTTTSRVRTLRIVPLSSPIASKPNARTRPHAHHCAGCDSIFECGGADEMGYCPPVCGGCYWIELGSQLRIYKEMVTELERKRRSIEERIGKSGCKAAERRRREARGQDVVVAFGNVFKSSPTGELEKSTGDHFSGRGKTSCAEQAQGGAASDGK